MRGQSIAWTAGALMLLFPQATQAAFEREDVIRFLVNSCFDQLEKQTPPEKRDLLEIERLVEYRIQVTEDLLPETRKTFSQIARELKTRHGCGLQLPTPA